MNWLVYHIVSGQAFFSGIVLLIIAVLASTRSRPVFSRVTVTAFVAGVIAVVVSSTAISYLLYAVAAVVTLGWIVSRSRKSWRRRAANATVAVWLIAALAEVPYHISSPLRPTGSRSVTIIGDSVTAGMGGEDVTETWPRILAREHRLQVQDIAHIGETASSALKRAKSIPITAPLVIVEIGGNDILGSTTSHQFADDLDALLTYLVAADRQIVMFELPLPPFCHEFGRAQRSAAARHNVILIPKRVFLSVLADSASTLDTIHLSQSGHKLMAECVWRMIKSAFDTSDRSSSN